jgi:uncharacterized membrane protein YeaQ/YmgE (transglycosylase-associated protein family)
MPFVWFILIGLAAGFIAGKIMTGRGFGAVGNLIVGVIGAIIGGLLFSLLGLSANNLIGQLVTAVAGAVILLMVIGYTLKKT